MSLSRHHTRDVVSARKLLPDQISYQKDVALELRFSASQCPKASWPLLCRTPMRIFREHLNEGRALDYTEEVRNSFS